MKTQSFNPNFIYNDNNINKLLLLNSITNQYVIHGLMNHIKS